MKSLAILKKNWSVIVLVVIIAAGIFFRTYKFDDWLYFKMDQSRDALLVANAVEKGPQYLPLLGPRVGAVKLEHGMLRVGPIFYYFQYLAGKIFNSTEPYVFAYPDLLFSILAIPLLYLFVRLYFSKGISLLIAAMYASSFLIIEYSRFAWNPNSLQFFLLLAFYGLLRFLNDSCEKRKRVWLAVWVLGLTIGSQLHFFGFFSLLGISGLMLLVRFQLWKKEMITEAFKKAVLKQIAIYGAIGAAVFLFFYTPEIISDIYKHGENTHNFFEALTAKPEAKPFSQKISKGATENLKYYCLLTTSDCYGSSFKKEIPALTFTLFVLIIGVALLIRGIRIKQTPLRRDFLMLMLIWVGVFTILTVPVAFQLRPRFYIVVFAAPFIFLGLIYEFLNQKLNKKYSLAAALTLTLIVIAMNLQGIHGWFNEQAKSQREVTAIKRTLILKAKDGVTLGQLKNVTDWMYSRHIEGDSLYYYIKPEHIRPIEFLLTNKHDKKLNFFSMKLNGDPHAQFFAITSAKDTIQPFEDKYGVKTNVLASQQFGQLKVWEVEIPGRNINTSFKIKKSSEGDDRVFWKDVLFNSKNTKK